MPDPPPPPPEEGEGREYPNDSGQEQESEDPLLDLVMEDVLGLGVEPVQSLEEVLRDTDFLDCSLTSGWEERGGNTLQVTPGHRCCSYSYCCYSYSYYCSYYYSYSYCCYFYSYSYYYSYSWPGPSPAWPSLPEG